VAKSCAARGTRAPAVARRSFLAVALEQMETLTVTSRERRSGLPIRSVRNHVAESSAISRLGLDLGCSPNHADAPAIPCRRRAWPQGRIRTCAAWYASRRRARDAWVTYRRR